jgi:hypothetical protein
MRILAIYYTQSGQLEQIIRNFLAPLDQGQIEYCRLQPAQDFPFPWNDKSFYEAMPETVQEEGMELLPLNLKSASYDLIVVGYQPWFLSPSLPTSALFNSKEFRAVANNTPIVTVIGARNMWLNAQESIKRRIQEIGAKHLGNIALVDRNPNLLSAVSIAHWMMTGKKTRKYGIFPLPGVSQKDIVGSNKFGTILKDCLESNELPYFQEKLREKGGVFVPTTILFIEGRAKKIFRLWAKLIKSKEGKGKRALWIRIFKFYLHFALFCVAPILLLVYTIFVRPFTSRSINEKKQYFCSVEYKPNEFI